MWKIWRDIKDFDYVKDYAYVNKIIEGVDNIKTDADADFSVDDTESVNREVCLPTSNSRSVGIVVDIVLRIGDIGKVIDSSANAPTEYLDAAFDTVDETLLHPTNCALVDALWFKLNYVYLNYYNKVRIFTSLSS